jgi:hypothetical protein
VLSLNLSDFLLVSCFPPGRTAAGTSSVSYSIPSARARYCCGVFRFARTRLALVFPLLILALVLAPLFIFIVIRLGDAGKLLV